MYLIIQMLMRELNGDTGYHPSNNYTLKLFLT